MIVNAFLYAETVINGRDGNRIMLSTYELLIILVLVLLFFGKDKIPELFRGAGQAKKAFNEGMNEPLPEDSGEDKVEGPMEEDGKGDIDGDGIPDSEDEEPRVSDSKDEKESDSEDDGHDESHNPSGGGFG